MSICLPSVHLPTTITHPSTRTTNPSTYMYTYNSLNTLIVLFAFQLLEECTSRLGLTLSAKRLFLSDGTEVKDVYDLKKDENVYVSSGQPFRDPLQAGKGMNIIRFYCAYHESKF